MTNARIIIAHLSVSRQGDIWSKSPLRRSARLASQSLHPACFDKYCNMIAIDPESGPTSPTIKPENVPEKPGLGYAYAQR